MKNERLTQRQLLALLWAGLLAPAVEALPVDAGPGTWLSTLIALPVLAAVLVLWRGGELPKLLAALYGLWGVVLLAVRLRLCAQRLLGAGWMGLWPSFSWERRRWPSGSGWGIGPRLDGWASAR